MKTVATAYNSATEASRDGNKKHTRRLGNGRWAKHIATTGAPACPGRYEVLIPIIIILLRSVHLAPDNVVGGVDGAIEVEIAGN